jgi:hypothetical protein
MNKQKAVLILFSPCRCQTAKASQEVDALDVNIWRDPEGS